MNHVEQNLTNEIVAVLLREDLHTRAIAVRLSCNHSTVLRKLRDLAADNVVDSRPEGKNKVYFIRKSIEGRNAAMIAELYKQSRTVGSYPVLRGIVQEIQKMPEISLAVLFGSYAKNRASRESDVDLFVETSDAAVKKRLEQRNSSLSVKIGELDTGNLLIREIIKDHVIIKGVEVYFDKTRFFEKTA